MKNLNYLNLSLFLTIGCLLFLHFDVQAEPWLANRFSQNCAGCHAPGRYNLPAAKRKCTLSCQGCHVNPSGGGLRNEYGKWTQQRWLKTFKMKGNKFDKPIPAPDFAQHYMRKSKTLKYKKKARKKKIKKRKIPKMVSIQSTTVKEEHYDQFSNRDWKIDAKSDRQFLSRVPAGDPYRLERSRTVTAGGDFRYFYGSFSSKTNPATDFDFNILMGADIGVRFKPTKEHLSLVVENRFSGNPRGEDTGIFEGFGQSRVRSAYVLTDGWFHNLYGMYGLYRPHFGYNTPDHANLVSDLTGIDQNSVYQAIGVGATPFNVPFINLHYIMKNDNFSDRTRAGVTFQEESGININAGARFVTLGLSGKVSYWATTSNNDIKRNLISVSGGSQFKRITGNFDYTRWSVLSPKENAGNVLTFDGKFRVWRENYAMITLSDSNTSREGKVGKSTEFGVGFRSYLFAGLKLDALISTMTDSNFEDDIETEESMFFLQLHAYF